MAGDVGENGLVDSAQIPDGFEVHIHLVVAEHRQPEIIPFEHFDTFFQDDGGVIHASLSSFIVDVILTVL